MTRFMCSCGKAFDSRRRLMMHIAGERWEHFEAGRKSAARPKPQKESRRTKWEKLEKLRDA